MEVLHHSVEGIHHPAGMVPKLAASLHLLWVLHVLELAEVLFGRWEVDKEPKEASTFQITLDTKKNNERKVAFFSPSFWSRLKYLNKYWMY